MVKKANKKNIGWKILIFSFLGGVSVMLGFVAYDWWLERRAHFVRYAEFGIDIPINYTIHGIDVSKYQEIVDWNLVRDMKVGNVQMSFAFIKATEGLGNEDAYFKRNWKKIKDAGMARGAYHFFLATKSGKAQAICRPYWTSNKPTAPPVKSCGSGQRSGCRPYRTIIMSLR
jgi:lysozyme